MLNNKRGLSPLISTVLLVFAAIAVGVIVMNWGRATLEENAKCAIDTKMDVVRLNEEPQVCYAGSGKQGMIHFIVENGPSVEVEKLHFRVIGEKGVFTTELSDSDIDIGSSIIKDVPYDFELFGDIRQVKISPMLVLYPQEPPLLCSEQGIVAEELKPCK